MLPPSAPPPPPNAPPDLAAAWAAMCPPVQARYAAEGVHNRARRLALSLLGREVARRGAKAAPRVAGISVEPRILALRPDNLGDALLTTPAWTLLKRVLPGAYLTVLGGPLAAEVASHCPAVDRVRVLSFPGFGDAPARLPGPLGRVERGLHPYALLLGQAGALAAEQYDVAIVFRPDHWWGAALAALATVPQRVGYATPETAPFLTHALPLGRLPIGKPLPRDDDRTPIRQTRPPHVAEQSLALARQVVALAQQSVPDDFDSRMRFEPAAAERADAWRLWRANGLDAAPAVVAIHPSPAGASKRWTPDRFAYVADHLAGRHGARVVLTGSRSDEPEVRAIAAACRSNPVVLTGQTGFGALAALLERCRFAIGTDNGAMHLAIARGVPTLRLFGPIAPEPWAAWPLAAHGGPLSRVIASSLACAPCHRLDVPPWEQVSGTQMTSYPCMQDVGVDAVVATVEELWALTADRTNRA